MDIGVRRVNAKRCVVQHGREAQPLRVSLPGERLDMRVRRTRVARHRPCSLSLRFSQDCAWEKGNLRRSTTRVLSEQKPYRKIFHDVRRTSGLSGLLGWAVRSAGTASPWTGVRRRNGAERSHRVGPCRSGLRAARVGGSPAARFAVSLRPTSTRKLRPGQGRTESTASLTRRSRRAVQARARSPAKVALT